MAEDGEMLDSWEDQVDSGVLDERLKKISVSKPEEETGSTSNAPIMMKEDTGRTEYKPQVRILKRDPNPTANSLPGNSPRLAKVNKPTKTLEQREAEYAEARLRIFGSADSEADINSSNNASDTGAPASTDGLARGAKVEINKSPNSVAVLRQPKGPDGSKGFSSTR
ncbi:hypothetical protein BaRGS_00006874 [Batillaria attramentaria]|uniref:SUZ RNA-binding domain-containing n=1 Tax=Batillaria attramentaria TaxID=370345 RepID=A0ABD0LQQ2_9CAEN